MVSERSTFKCPKCEGMVRVRRLDVTRPEGESFAAHCATCQRVEYGESLDGAIEEFFNWTGRKGDENRPCPRCGTPCEVALAEDLCSASVQCFKCGHVSSAKDIDGAWSAFQWWAKGQAEVKPAGSPSIAEQYPHYFRTAPSSTIDIYRVLELWNVTDPCIQHAIKKLLTAGNRGAKAAMGQTVERDVNEAIIALQRWQEMRKEELGVGAHRTE